MADITITCPGCGNRVTISEFVSAPSLACARCGGSIPVPRREAPPPAAAGLRLASPTAAPDGAPAPAPEVQAPVAVPAPGRRRWRRSRRPSRRPTRRQTSRVWPWVLFVILAAVLAWLRFFPGALSASQLATFKLAGVYGLLGLHVVIVLQAFNDDTFEGVMSLLIPGYSLYYLFVLTDLFYLRALVVAAMLVFGKDTAIALQRTWGVVYRDVTAWIQGNETFKKDLPR